MIQPLRITAFLKIYIIICQGISYVGGKAYPPDHKFIFITKIFTDHTPHTHRYETKNTCILYRRRQKK